VVVIPDWLVAWLHGNDHGLSSRFLASCMLDNATLRQVTEEAAPRDTADVGRCVRLLDLAMANGHDWRAAMPTNDFLLAQRGWVALVPRWTEIEAAYHEDVAAQNAWNKAHPRHRYWMPGTSKRAAAHNAVRTSFPPSRCWWLVATLQERYDPYSHVTPHPFMAIS
jgi:hypothetical protein